MGLFREYEELLGVKIDMGAIFRRLFEAADQGDPDCGGLLSFNYVSGEPVTGFAEGRPLFVRSAGDGFNLANFMRAVLYSTVGVLKIGNDVLLKEEKVKVDRITGHGGLFKVPGVGQPVLAAALDSPISDRETAGDGGAWASPSWPPIWSTIPPECPFRTSSTRWSSPATAVRRSPPPPRMSPGSRRGWTSTRPASPANVPQSRPRSRLRTTVPVRPWFVTSWK